MKYERVTDEQKEKILELKAQGMRTHEIASLMGLSESGTYRIIQMSKVKELPTVDDSKVVQELRERIKLLESELVRCHSIIDKLLDK